MKFITKDLYSTEQVIKSVETGLRLYINTNPYEIRYNSTPSLSTNVIARDTDTQKILIRNQLDTIIDRLAFENKCKISIQSSTYINNILTVKLKINEQPVTIEI